MSDGFYGHHFSHIPMARPFVSPDGTTKALNAE
jgi:hypothetical protein